jgi:intracellular septation protein
MSDKKKTSSSWSLLVDYGPLLTFFAAYKLAGSGLQGAIVGTIAFMIAIVVALIIGLTVLKRVPPMVWLSAVLILGFGGVTLYFRDPRYIEMKPTAIYVLFAVTLFVGLFRGKPLLRWLFGPAFPGLSEAGWLKLSRNWAIFFSALAVANEIMRANLPFDTWLTLKVWGVSVASFLFAISNVPMLLRHGLDPDAKAEVAKEAPVE